VLLILGILLLFVLVVNESPGSEHVTKAKMYKHIYFLDFIRSDEPETPYIYRLYRCDQLGLFCARVCEFPTTHTRERLNLLTDEHAQTVSITLDGAPVCTYPEQNPS
jgi:hypothetical protein